MILWTPLGGFIYFGGLDWLIEFLLFTPRPGGMGGLP
jgi:hypothetical protein